MANTAAHKPPEIITRFARQLSRILTDYLIDSNGGHRHPVKDRLAIKLMLTLSEKSLYRQELLFRDYSEEQAELWMDYLLPDGNRQKLHTESIFYVEAVLGKRLAIVSKRKSLPTNLHILLLMLCRYSVDKRWLRTWIKRKHEITALINEPFFDRVMNELKRQASNLKNMSAVSKTYRERYGVLYLIVGSNRAEVPEEMSLFDVVTTVPTPLSQTIQKPPVWYPALVERILLSLNESYSLLRSCGLPPQEFWDVLSVGKLRELKSLKKLADGYLKTGVTLTLYDAYELAFVDWQKKQTAYSKSSVDPDKKIKIAGFEDFFDFAGSAIGAKLLQTRFVSLYTENEESQGFSEITAVIENSSAELEYALGSLMVDAAKSFTPVTAYFF